MEGVRPEGLIVGFFLMVFFLGIIVAQIFYLLTLQKSLTLSKPYHRMSPGLVWLMFIPLFSLGWQFYIISNVTKGIKGSYASFKASPGDAGWNVGLATAILMCCSIIPFLGILCSICGLVTWIIYWVKVANFNREMAAHTGSGFAAFSGPTAPPPQSLVAPGL